MALSPHYQPWAEPGGLSPSSHHGCPQSGLWTPLFRAKSLPGGLGRPPSPQTGWELSWHPQIAVAAPQFREEEGTEVAATSVRAQLSPVPGSAPPFTSG